MGQVHAFDHPLIQHKIAMLRDKNTNTKDFRELVSEIAMLMCYEVTRNLELEDVDVETPVGIAHAKMLAGKESVLRACASCRPWHGRRGAQPDPDGKGRTYRTVSGSRYSAAG